MIKTIFDNSTRAELINRINSLNGNSQAQWGKMDVHAMAKHCIIWNEWILGKKEQEYKQGLLGKLFGKMALKGMVKDNTPMKKGMPAGTFTVKKFSGDLETQKKLWVDDIINYGNFSNPKFVHDFFGVMTAEQIGILAYKHMDHHLRQFGV